MSDRTSQVTVVTDSAAALSREQIDEFHLFVARMEIIIDGTAFIDSPEGDLSDFYSNLVSSVEIPTTSAPKPAEYLEQFRSAAAVSDNIFCVTVSSRLSASNDAARMGTELLANELPETVVRVFDSGTAASSQALISLAAARVAGGGAALWKKSKRPRWQSLKRFDWWRCSTRFTTSTRVGECRKFRSG